MHFSGTITLLALLAPLVLASPRPDQGPGGGDSSGSGGSGSSGGGDDGADDDDGGEGDVTADIPAACLDVCTPVADLKNECIVEFGDNANALACFCTATSIDVATLVPECSDCVAAALDPEPVQGDLKGKFQACLSFWGLFKAW